MPNGNGTGPVGAGPMTGRGAGKCAGNATAGWENTGGGGKQRGLRRNGTPRGFFRNHTQHAVASAEAMMLQGKIDVLHRQLASLEQQLTNIAGKQED